MRIKILALDFVLGDKTVMPERPFRELERLWRARKIAEAKEISVCRKMRKKSKARMI